MTFRELWKSEEGNSIADVARRRNSVVQTLGNLTILSMPPNSAVSNYAWKDKQPKLLEFFLLPVNKQLFSCETWDEEAIERRGKELFEMAKSIWLVLSQQWRDTPVSDYLAQYPRAPPVFSHAYNSRQGDV